jgi:fluoroacetyl-CoA thioesterase
MAELTFTVTPEHLATAAGSGEAPVLATPTLLAWIEAATCAALDLPEDQTSVGVHVELDHTTASPVGAQITTTAEINRQDGRTVRFSVQAHDRHGHMVAHGEVVRVIVSRERFIARVPAP